MDIASLTDNYISIVVIACLVIGYCIKHVKWLDAISNQYIPTILAICGAIIGCIANGIALENIVYGALSGLASTGFHQLFNTLINRNNDVNNSDKM